LLLRGRGGGVGQAPPSLLPSLLIDALPSDLKGGAVGEAAERTRALLDRAKGSVLFIDE
jgi:hypothetical protein